MARQDRPLRPWEAAMQLDGLEAAIDRARTDFQLAGLPHLAEAAQDSVQNSVHGSVHAPDPPAALADALTREIALLEDYGHRTVLAELDAQRPNAPAPTVTLNWVEQAGGLPGGKAGKFHRLVDHLQTGPTPMAEGHAIATTVNQARKYCAKGHADWCALAAEWETKKAQAHALAAGDPDSAAKRGWLAAAAVASAIWHAVAGAKVNGNTSPDRLQQLGHDTGVRALHHQALGHAAGALQDGRETAAQQHADEVAGARYTSILDPNRCESCKQADDGVLRALDDPWWADHTPPNPACASVASGLNRCRCMRFYQLREEAPAHLEAG